MQQASYKVPTNSEVGTPPVVVCCIAFFDVSTRETVDATITTTKQALSSRPESTREGDAE